MYVVVVRGYKNRGKLEHTRRGTTIACSAVPQDRLLSGLKLKAMDVFVFYPDEREMFRISVSVRELSNHSACRLNDLDSALSVSSVLFGLTRPTRHYGGVEASPSPE